MTHKDQIEQLQGQVSDLQGKLTAAEGNVSTLTTQANAAKANLTKAEGERDTFRTQFQTEQTAHAETRKQLAAAEQERDTLKAQDKTAGGKAAEMLAANGIPPVQRDNPASVAESQKDGAAIYAEYERLMAAGDNRAATAHWNAHEKALDAYAAELSRKK